MGQVMMMITHTGHKSGLPRHTLVEFHQLNGKKYALSGFGGQSQWYRNIHADPHVTSQTSDGTEHAIATRVTDGEEIVALLSDHSADGIAAKVKQEIL